MIRARFKLYRADFLPAIWPFKHPFWCSGQGDDYLIVIAYADDEEEFYTHWPDAEDVDFDEREDYTFTDRFPKPDWFQPEIPERIEVVSDSLFVDQLHWLVIYGCSPNVSIRNGLWRVSINRCGNYWAEDKELFKALEQAYKLWYDAGQPKEN